MMTEDEIINNIDLSDFTEKNDIFGFEASKKKVFIIQEDNKISDLEAKIRYAANRVFVNNGDSYHGKYIIQEISQVILENIEYIDPNNKLIENIKTDEGFKQESSYKNLQQSSNKILKQTSLKQNQTIFTDPENNIKSASYDTYIKENRSLDNAYIKESIDNNNDKIEGDLKSIVNEETLPMYNTNKPTIKLSKQGIESTNYDIVATVKNKLRINNERYKYLKHIKKLIIPNNKRLLLNEVRKCAVVVYDISLDKSQIVEAEQAIQKIVEEIHFIKNNPKSLVAKKSGHRVFILISSIQTWALTTKKENEIPLTQADYKHRICHPNFQAFYDLENYLLLLNDKYSGYFYGIVLAPGLVYGHGEKMLKYIYETALSSTEPLLIPKYNNNLPIIHVDNLAKIVKNLVMYHDKITTPYIVGVETSRFSLRNITEAIKDNVKKTNYVYCNYSSLFLNTSVTQTVYDMVTMSIDIIPVIDDFITQFIESNESIPQIFTETHELISEYLCQNSEKKNIIINGPHEITNFAQKLAHTYNLNFIDPVTISEDFLNTLENSIDDIVSLLWSKIFTNNESTNQTPTKLNNMSNDMILHTLNMQHIESNSEYNEKNQEKLDKIKLLEEQKKNFKDKGQISDKYLLPLIKNKILNSRENKCGYIISNFPESIEQAQDIFNLEQLESKKENNIQFIKDKIHPTILIDVIMAGKNVMNNCMYNLEKGPVQLDFNSKLLIDDKLDTLHEWFILDSKYTENEITKYILENDNIEIRRNRKMVDYFEVLFNPKVHKEYILITQNNFILLDHKEFDKLFDSLLVSIPIQMKDIKAENEVSFIKSMVTFKIHHTIISNKVIENEEENRKNQDQLLKETIKKEHLRLGNMKIINFLIKCINPILVNGMLEIMKNMPSDPIDFLVEYIYNHNMYSPCVSSPVNKKPKVANSLNKHLL